MAKVSGPWLRGAKKKLAGVVLQKGGSGETIAREWVKPKNPQTQKQMAQRIIFATVAQAAKFMAPIVNHSFEGVEYGEKSLQRFKQLNLRRLRELASWDYDHSPTPTNAKSFMTTRRISALIPNSYIVSEGSLPSSPVILDHDTTVTAKLPHVELPLVEDAEIEGKGVYVFDVIKNLFGLEPGWQLTFCVIQGDGEFRFTYEDQLGAVIPYTDFKAFRIVMKSNAVNAFIPIPEGEEYIETIYTEVEKCIDFDKSNMYLLHYLLVTNCAECNHDQAYTKLCFEFVLEGIAYMAGQGDDMMAYGSCVVVSKPNGNTWLRSSEKMDITFPNNTANFGLTWDVALDAWFRGEVIAESNRFLNEGGAVNEIG